MIAGDPATTQSPTMARQSTTTQSSTATTQSLAATMLSPTTISQPSFALQFCNTETVGDENFTGVYKFSNTTVDSVSSLSCVYNKSLIIQRRCILSSLNKPIWEPVDVSVCPAKSQTAQQLLNINKITITALNVETTASNLNQIVQKGNLSTVYDINLISTIIANIIKVNFSSFEVTNHILLTIDTVLSNAVMVTEANKQFNVSSNFLSQMDDLGKQQTGNMTISTKNLALASYSIETNQNPVFIYSTLNQSNLIVKISSNETSILQNNRAYIMLSPQLFIGKSKTHVYSYVFLENNVFFSGHSTSISSIILSATINGQNVNNSNSPISMMFLRNTNIIGNSTCQFYKIIEQVWSTEGCRTIKSSSEEVFCQCNHLTNFALIIDTDQSDYNPLSLQIITWIGCGISIAGLFITILTYLIFPKLRSNLPVQILINLCVSLMMTMIVFLSLVERTQPQLLCRVVASLLQYFILSTFFWMAVEGINYYIMFVKIFRGSYRSRIFMLKSCAFAYGVPLIITVVTAAVKPANLGPLTSNDPKICVVRGLSFYFGILLPICMVVIVNLVFIFLVLRGMGGSSNVESRIDIKRKVRIVFGCSLLIGTTWIFAVLAVGNLRDVFQWLFCIFNSLQGFFIFLFYVAQNKDVKTQWRLLLGKRNAAIDGIRSSGNANRNQFA